MVYTELDLDDWEDFYVRLISLASNGITVHRNGALLCHGDGIGEFLDDIEGFKDLQFCRDGDLLHIRTYCGHSFEWDSYTLMPSPESLTVALK